MKKKQLFLSILTIITLLSCERTLDVDFSNEKPLIVMNGTIEPDMPINIFISKSFPLLDTAAFSAYLKDASVELHINDKFVEKMQLVNIDSTSYYSQKGKTLFSSKAHAKIGDRVKVKASVPGLETAWAETLIPTPPTIGKVDTATFFIFTQNDKPYHPFGYGNYFKYPAEITREPFFRLLRLHIDVQRANNNAPQYFLIGLSSMTPTGIEGKYSVYYGLSVNTQDDPIFANDPKNSLFDALFEKNHAFNGSVFFSDNAFKNSSYTLNISTYGFYEVAVEYEKTEEGSPEKYKSHKVNNLPVEIKILSLAPDWYAYLKSKERGSYDDEGLGFITEPKITPTNVHNGIGFLGSMSHTSKRIETPPFTGKKNEVPR